MTLPDGFFYDLNPALLAEGPLGAGVTIGTPIDLGGHDWVVDYESTLAHNYATQPAVPAGTSGGWLQGSAGTVALETDPTIGMYAQAGRWAVARDSAQSSGGIAGAIAFEIRALGSHDGEPLPLPDGTTELFVDLRVARDYSVSALGDVVRLEFYDSLGTSLGFHEQVGLNPNLAAPVPVGARGVEVIYRAIYSEDSPFGETSVGVQALWLLEVEYGHVSFPETPDTDPRWTWNGAPGASSSTFLDEAIIAEVEHAPLARIVQKGTGYAANFVGGPSGMIGPGTQEQPAEGASMVLAVRIAGDGAAGAAGTASAAFPFVLGGLSFVYDAALGQLVFEHDPAVKVAPGDHVFGYTTGEAGIEVYVDGARVALVPWESTTGAYYEPSSTSLYFTDSLFRLITWDRVLTASEMAEASADIAPALPGRAVTWAPGADGGAPITSYVLRSWNGQRFVETKYPANALAGEVPGDAIAAQLMAVNAVGRGTPAEVAL